MTGDPFEEDDVSDVFPGSTIKVPQRIAEIIDDDGPWFIKVLGTPRTKKTSNDIHLTVHPTKLVEWVRSLLKVHPSKLMRAILSRVKVQPNKLWRQWAKKAPIQYVGNYKCFPIEGDVHVRATFYRERAIGDLTGYLQGLGDLLQDREIIANDRQIVSWDGSRLTKDKEKPRVELTIARFECVPRKQEGAEGGQQTDLLEG